MKILFVDSDIDELRRVRELDVWKKYEIESFFTAYGVQKAIELSEIRFPDILICDSKLQDGSGLELAEWFREKMPQTELIVISEKLSDEEISRFFDINVLDCLKKPLDEKHIETAVNKYLNKIEEHRMFEENKRYAQYWKAGELLIKQMFWERLCEGRAVNEPEYIEEKAQSLGMSVNKDGRFRVALFNTVNRAEMFERWGNGFTAGLLQKTAAEVLEGNEDNYHVIIINNRLAVIFDEYTCGNAEEKCSLICERAKEESGAKLQCMLSEEVYCEHISEAYLSLEDYIKNGAAGRKNVINVKLNELYSSCSINVKEKWAKYLGKKKPHKLTDEIKEYLAQKEEKKGLSEFALNLFRQDMLQLFYIHMDKKKINAHQLFDMPETAQLYKTAVNSSEDMCAWIDKCISVICTDTVNVKKVEKSELTDEIIRYVSEHIKEDITVKDIARHINLSPDYTTRVFKKSMGMPLKEYLIKMRMEKAKELLLNSDMAVSIIAAESGYDNFSHFSKIFNKTIGSTPKQYRKKNRQANM